VRTDHPGLLMGAYAVLLLAASLPSQAVADPAIAFVASRAVTVGHGNNAVTTAHFDLMVMDADGRNPTVVLTRTSGSSSTLALDDPTWSPDLDGNRANGFQGCLAVLIREGANGSYSLYVMDIAVSGGIPQASNLRKLVDAATDPNVGVGGGAFDPEWSPDLDLFTTGYQGAIAFIGSTDGGHSSSVNLIAMVWDGATAQLVGPPSSSVVLFDGHPTGEFPFNPTWSPDGARIATNEGSRILVIDAATGWKTSTLSLSSYAGDGQWSRTSSRVAFGIGPISTIDVDAGVASLAVVSVPNSGGSRHPTWSPDDSSLVFANVASTNKSKWNIVRMNLSTGAQTVLVNGQTTGRNLRLSKPDWRRF